MEKWKREAGRERRVLRLCDPAAPWGANAACSPEGNREARVSQTSLRPSFWPTPKAGDVAFTWQLHKLVAASRFYQCSQSCPTLCDSMDHSCQAPLSMEFFRREASSGLPWPPPGDLLDPGIEPLSPSSPAVAGDCSPLSHQGNFEWRGASTLAPLAVWVQDGLGVRESLRQELPLWSRG